MVQQSNRVRELAAWKIEEDRMNFFNSLGQSGASLLCFVFAATLAGSAFAQEHRERTRTDNGSEQGVSFRQTRMKRDSRGWNQGGCLVSPPHYMYLARTKSHVVSDAIAGLSLIPRTLPPTAGFPPDRSHQPALARTAEPGLVAMLQLSPKSSRLQFRNRNREFEFSSLVQRS